MRVLAVWAILPAGITVWFFLFWTRFEFWRKHRVLTYATMAAIFVATATAVVAIPEWTFASRLSMPLGIRIAGWGVIAAATVFGWIADRQIGLRVRSFAPFFAEHARIKLRTTGAYGIVRHPIYAAGRVFQFGVFLVTGYPSVLAAWAIFGLGAIWFSRQEERRLVELLEDPLEYQRYRERVPALFFVPRPRRSSA